MTSLKDRTFVASSHGMIKPNDRRIVPVDLPPNTENSGEVFAIPRPSLVAKHGVTVLGSPQQINLDDPKVILFNSSNDEWRYKAGSPVAGMIFMDKP